MMFVVWLILELCVRLIIFISFFFFDGFFDFLFVCFFSYTDNLENELQKEIGNGRLLLLLAKIAMINENEKFFTFYLI